MPQRDLTARIRYQTHGLKLHPRGSVFLLTSHQFLHHARPSFSGSVVQWFSPSVPRFVSCKQRASGLTSGLFRHLLSYPLAPLASLAAPVIHVILSRTRAFPSPLPLPVAISPIPCRLSPRPYRARCQHMLKSRRFLRNRCVYQANNLSTSQAP